jgi:hypothetical protein
VRAILVSPQHYPQTRDNFHEFMLDFAAGMEAFQQPFLASVVGS